jgi:penicillin-binding protein 1C
MEWAAWRSEPVSLARFEDRSLLVVDAGGAVLRGFLARDERWRLLTRPEDVPDYYIDMLLAYEDHRFRTHAGIDPLALLRAMAQTLWYGRSVSGASTLTMQAARLLEPRGRGVSAKLRQMVVARQLERRFDKDQILTIYLTLAPFGGNIEGVRAAALAYFGKEPSQLTRAEAAMLITLPQSPERRRPDRNPKGAAEAWRQVVQRVTAAGVVTGLDAAAEPPRARRSTIAFAAPHLAEQVMQRHGRQNAGPIRTTIDGTLQRRIEALIGEALAAWPAQVNAAVLVVRNSDRAVLAYAGGGDWQSAERAGQVDLVRAVRSPGSTLKPLIYGMAFEQRIVHPETVLTDAPVQFGQYEPENFSREYAGDMTVRDALIRSINTGAVAVLAKVGAQKLMTRMRSVGTPLRITDLDRDAGLAIGLGGGGLTLWDLATIYCGLANRGVVHDLRIKPEDAAGPARQLLSEEAAWAVTDILADATPPPGFTRRAAGDGSRRLAYKTGTSYGFRDAWAAGFDGLHTVAVWVGRPDGQPHVGAYGASDAAPLLFRVFDALEAAPGDVAGPPPPGSILAERTGIPERLRRFDISPIDPVRQKLRILFPQPNATIALATTDGRRLPLEVQGGTAPYVWIANDAPLGDASFDARTYWTPQGRGSQRITVLDAEGRTDSVEIWLE